MGLSAQQAFDGGYGFRDLLLTVAMVVFDGMHHAMAKVFIEQTQTHALQRFAHRSDLCEYVDAIRVVVNHPLQSSNLALNAAEPHSVVVLLH